MEMELKTHLSDFYFLYFYIFYFSYRANLFLRRTNFIFYIFYILFFIFLSDDIRKFISD